MELIYSFYRRLHRKAPGSASSTRRAWSMLSDLPPEPRVVDFGCGSGVSTLALAQTPGVLLTAVEIHAPFLDSLRAKAAAANCSDRITTLCADMNAPPLADKSFDVVWSEGAIYQIGFAEGLRRWRRFLRPGGCLAVSEASWLCDSPPPEAKAFWNAEYPAMTTIEGNLAAFEAADLKPVGHFVLPRQDWADYLEPMEREARRLRDERPGDAEVRTFTDAAQREVDLWRAHGESYGYVFYLGRAI